MKVSVNNEHIIKENRNITPSIGDGLSGLFNNLSQVKNSCKAFLIGDEKLKSKIFNQCAMRSFNDSFPKRELGNMS